MKKLTIAIPTYNRAQYLPTVLTSILKQKSDDIEILVVDNASTDGTYNYMMKILNLNPDIRYIRNQTNLGADGNFLKCYEVASGEYVMLLGSDDYLMDGAINEIVQFLTEHNESDFLMLNFNMFDENNKNIMDQYLEIDRNIYLNDKNAFIRHADVMITFMSCMIYRTKLMRMVPNPQKYIGTHFIHTCIFFEASKKPICNYGIISKPCVAANITEGNGSAEGSFKIFGECLHHVLCDIGPQFGFDNTLLENIFYKDVKKNWHSWIVNSVITNNGKVNEYKVYGKPCLNKHLGYRLFLDMLSICPSNLLILVKKVKNLVSRKRYGKS